MRSDILGGSQDLTQGDICYGYHAEVQPAREGTLTSHAGQMTPFAVDTESFWDRWKYGKEFMKNIRNAFK